MRNAQDTIRARRHFLGFIALLCVVAWVDEAMGAQWDQPAVIEYNPATSRVPESQMAEVIEYAAWSWSERTGHPIAYAGTTDATVIEGRIVIVWEDLPLLVEGTYSILYGKAAWRYNPDTGVMIRAIITLNRRTLGTGGTLTKCDKEVIVHEIGHGLGINHTADSHDVMNGSRGACRYSLSTGDVVAGQYGADTCYAELTPDLDLYLPDLKAEMAYEGAVDGYQTWSLISNAPGLSQCASVRDGQVTLTDVRTLGRTYTVAVLEPWMGKWRLVELR